MNTLSRGSESITILKGLPYRNRRNLLHPKPLAKVSDSIWLYHFSRSVRLRLAYCTTFQHCPPGNWEEWSLSSDIKFPQILTCSGFFTKILSIRVDKIIASLCWLISRWKRRGKNQTVFRHFKDFRLSLGQISELLRLRKES